LFVIVIVIVIVVVVVVVCSAMLMSVEKSNDEVKKKQKNGTEGKVILVVRRGSKYSVCKSPGSPNHLISCQSGFSLGKAVPTIYNGG
jgi:hypothetical protein